MLEIEIQPVVFRTVHHGQVHSLRAYAVGIPLRLITDIAKLVQAFLEDNPEGSPDHVGRTVRNWVAGRSKPTHREDLFRIAFALGLSEGQANRLIGSCTDYGIHYRSGHDVVYAWFLRNGGSYRQARDFFASLPEIPRREAEPARNTVNLTRQLQNAFLQAHSPEELLACYLANLDNFGQLHNRAYAYFTRYLDKLIHPVPSWTGLAEPDYSLDAIMRLYFSMNMPSSRSRAGYSVVQRLIKYNWPNTTALKNIRARRADVPRKLLLLLYVITENVVDGEYRETDEDYLTATGSPSTPSSPTAACPCWTLATPPTGWCSTRSPPRRNP